MGRGVITLILLTACTSAEPPGSLSVVAIVPAEGPADQETLIRIDGRNFTRPIRSSVDDGVTTIVDLGLSFDGMPLSPPAWRGDTQLDAIVPAGLAPGSYDVELWVGDRSVTIPAGYTVLPAVDPVAPWMYVATEANELWRVDPATTQRELIGRIIDVDGTTSLYLHALALDGDTLVGITDVPRALVRIDPTTARVTSRVSIAVDHAYWGATMAPAGTFGVATPTLLVAANDTQNLYRVAADGTLIILGSFGGDLSVAGDISYVPGDGLYATVTAGACAGTCIARVAPSGAATLLGTSGPSDLWGLATVQGTLYAMGGNGQLYVVDRSTGAIQPTFATMIDAMSDTAP